nr:MAG TPA: hypothetical protein [Caudoviricetes sp.]
MILIFFHFNLFVLARYLDISTLSNYFQFHKIFIFKVKN